MEILTLILGLIVGGVLAALLAASRLASARGDTVRLEAELDVQRRNHEQLLAAAHQGHERQLADLRQATDSQIRLVAGNREALAEQMRSISAETLSRATEQLGRLAGEARRADREVTTGELKARAEEIKQAVAPIAESLNKVEKQVHELDRERRQTQGSVNTMFQSVASEVGRLRLETGHLVSALKRPQVRGAWGEMQLKNVVRAANMTEHVDFHVQPTLDAGEGVRLRPDLTVHLPSERDVVVDSKVPLDAYLAAVEAADDVARDGHLDRHARQLRTHLDKLASKAYHAQLESSAEFVVCFLPNEAVYCAALDRDPALLEHGATKGVLIATPTTLLALLYACAHGWQQASVEASAREIAAAAVELHKRCAKFLEDFARTGRALDSAVGSYNSAVGSLSARVLPQLRRMEDHGIHSERKLPAVPALDTPARRMAPGELAAIGGLESDPEPTEVVVRRGDSRGERPAPGPERHIDPEAEAA